jgi:luciferase-like monooxygenase
VTCGLGGAIDGFMQAAIWSTMDRILRALKARREVVGDFDLNVVIRSCRGFLKREGRVMKPFHFGVTLGRAPSRAAWVAKARHVEALGYAVLTVPDHLADFFAPLPALVSAAEATTHLRVGTHVLNNDFRHPVLVAREMATVDLFTEGRFQLGLGAGYMHAEYEEAGFRFEAGGRRVAR